MVSVVIPAYNAEKYIGCCIESVISQTYKDIEIVIVDDGSNDDTFKIASEFSKQDPRINVIHKENGGVSTARNLAINNVHGEYIFFMDADDTIESNAIETLVKAMESTGADWVNCQYSRWDEKGNRLEDFNFIEGEWSFSTDEEKLDFATNQILNYRVGFEVWDKLFRTSIVKNNSIEFSEKCRIGEDLAFNIKYFMHVHKINCISDRCLRYVIRGGSAMGKHKKLSDVIHENILLLEDIYEYASKIENQTFLEGFPLIYAKVMDNSYVGKCPKEIIEALDELEDKDFLKNIYKPFKSSKQEILNLYPQAIAKIKYRYHLYIFNSITGISVKDRVEILIYDFYRLLRHRPIIKNWKMPY